MPKLSFAKSSGLRLDLSAQQKKQIRLMYERVKSDVSSKIQALSALSNQTSTQSLQLLRLKQLKRAIDAEMVNVSRKFSTLVKENMQSVANQSFLEAGNFAKAYKLPFNERYAAIAGSAVERVLTGQVYDGSWTFSKAVWGMNNASNEDVAQIIAMGMAANKSAFDIAKDLEQYVDPSAAKPWDWSKVYPGVSKKVDYNAQRLARTLVTHAYQQATVQAALANPFVEGFEWRSAGTERTCDICNQLDGQIFKKDEVPMDHPMGMCTIIQIIPEYKDISDRLADWVNGKEDFELDAYSITLITGKYASVAPNPNADPNDPTIPTKIVSWLELKTNAGSVLDFKQGVTSQLVGSNNPATPTPKSVSVEISSKTVTVPEGYALRPDGTLFEKPKSPFEARKYSAGEKDKAYWFKNERKADKALRSQTGEIWVNAKREERQAAFEYTNGSGKFNRPLRGFDKGWGKHDFKGIGNVPLNNEGGEAYINGLTSLIERSTIDNNIWLTRGLNTDGAAGFFGIDPMDLRSDSQNKLKLSLLGRVYKDEAFTSTGTAKGTGFQSDVILNIYAPQGTKLIYAEPFSAYSKGPKQNWDGKTSAPDLGSELETIIQRGTSYRVIKVEKTDYKTYIDVEVVAQDKF